MKFLKLLVVLFLSSFVYSSCQKDIETQNQQSPVLSQAIPDYSSVKEGKTWDYIYKYKLDEIEVSEGSYSMEDESLTFLITGKPLSETDAELTIHAFTNKDNYYQFGRDNNIPTQKSDEVYSHLADYAEQSGAVAEFEKTGQIPTSYQEYMDNYLGSQGIQVRTLFGTFVFKDFNRNGNSSWIPPGGTPFMVTQNNQTSSYFGVGIFALDVIFDKAFFRQRMISIWGWQFQTINFSGPLAFLNDRATSWGCTSIL